MSLVFLETQPSLQPPFPSSLRSSSTLTSPQDVQQAKIMTPATLVSCPRRKYDVKRTSCLQTLDMYATCTKGWVSIDYNIVYQWNFTPKKALETPKTKRYRIKASVHQLWLCDIMDLHRLAAKLCCQYFHKSCLGVTLWTHMWRTPIDLSVWHNAATVCVKNLRILDNVS